MRRRSGWIWGGRITAVVILAGLAVYLASVGLDKADKLRQRPGPASRSGRYGRAIPPAVIRRRPS